MEYNRVVGQVRSGWRRRIGEWVDALLPDDGPRLEDWRPDEETAYCPRCGATTGFGASLSSGCAFCVGESMSWDRLFRLGAYEGALSRCIVAMKFAGAWRWGQELGEALTGTVRMTPRARVVVCPVPMHWLRRARRGYNQSQLMAMRLAQRRRWPCESLLRRVRYTVPQTTLTAAQRATNVARSFALLDVDLTGWDVVLVDDVKTTGATAGACAKLLKSAGANQVTVAVAAVADAMNRGFTRV